MTYVREQSSTELAVHMRSLQKMPGWHDPLADRLWQEVEALKAEVAGLKTGYEAYEQVNAELKVENERLDNALSITDAAAQKWLEERRAQQSALTEARELFDSILNDPRLVVAMPSALLVGVKDFISSQPKRAALGQGEQS